jgi:hypothetical protein
MYYFQLFYGGNGQSLVIRSLTPLTWDLTLIPIPSVKVSRHLLMGRGLNGQFTYELIIPSDLFWLLIIFVPYRNFTVIKHLGKNLYSYLKKKKKNQSEHSINKYFALIGQFCSRGTTIFLQSLMAIRPKQLPV